MKTALTRYPLLAGRLFVGFWLTILITAAVAITVTMMLDDPVELATADARQQTMLTRVAEQLARRPGPLPAQLQRVAAMHRHQLILVNLSARQPLLTSGPPVPERISRRLERLAAHQAPLVVSVRGMTVVGPHRLTLGQTDYALFVTRRELTDKRASPLLGWLASGLAVSLVLSLVFARTLARPIVQLQQASRSLAAGNWQARATIPAQRRDEIGQLARDFNQMADHLADNWQRQQRLLADISHELRSPLARLNMALGLLEQEYGASALMQRIETESQRLDQLIGQILQLSRAESRVLQPEHITLVQLCQPVIDDARFEAAGLNKTVNVSTLTTTPLWVDAAVLRAALDNILRNAVRHARQQVAVHATMRAGHCQLIIDDDGPGLDTAQQAAIFAPFYRVSTARERSRGGAGLGLAIAKAALDAHHGTIRASTASGGGLRVTLHFPLTQESHDPLTD